MTVYYSDIHGQESVLNGVVYLKKVTDDRLLAMMANGHELTLSARRVKCVYDGNENVDTWNT